MDPRKFGRRCAPEGEPGTPNAGAPPATPPAAPAAPAKPHTLASDLPDDALIKRINDAKATGRADLLKELGVTEEQLKGAVAAAKTAEDAKKSQETKLAEQALTLASQDQGLAAAIDAFALLITPEQKAAIDGIAGTDKSLWLKTYKSMAPTWGKPAPAVTPETAPATPPPAPVPTSTAPVTPAPAPSTTTTSPPDHKAIHKQLVATNPFKAARYADLHPEVWAKD